MRRTAVLALLVVGAVVPASARAQACGAEGDNTLLADGTSRVFDVDGSLFACRAGSPSRRLGHVATRTFGTAGVESDSVRLAGRYVAYVWHVGRTATQYEAVRVMELRRGVLRHSVLAWRAPAGGERALVVESLVVSARGSAAWVAQATRRDGSIVRALRVADRRGNLVLAQRRDIVATSLRLSHRGTRVHWRDGAGAHSARVA
jgi:hypothetical protein